MCKTKGHIRETCYTVTNILYSADVSTTAPTTEPYVTQPTTTDGSGGGGNGGGPVTARRSAAFVTGAVCRAWFDILAALTGGETSDGYCAHLMESLAGD